MIDEPDDDMDMQIATHIVKVHQRRERAFNVPYTMAQVQRYIRYARSLKPQVNEQVGLCNKSPHVKTVTAIHDTYAKSKTMSFNRSRRCSLLGQDLPAQAANAQDCKASLTSNAAYQMSRMFKLIDLCRPRMLW